MRPVTDADLAVWRDLKQSHYLYRCYDVDGRLIYIGCSSDVKRRMVTHRLAQRTASILLQQFMDRYEIDADVYAGRVAGKEAERLAIHTEQPVFNLQRTGNPHWKHNGIIAQYVLLATGRELPVRYVDGFEWGHRIDPDTLTEFFAEAVAS